MGSFNPINSDSIGAAFANKAFGKILEGGGVLTERDKSSLLDEFAQMGSAKSQQEAIGDLKQLEKMNPVLGGIGDETIHGLERDMEQLKKSDSLWSRAKDAVGDTFESVSSRAGQIRQSGVNAVADQIRGFNQDAADFKRQRIDKAVDGGGDK